MTISFDPYPRRDGKFKVTISFPGAPNAFGGHYYPKIYRKLYTLEKLIETIERNGTDEQKRWAASKAPKA